MGKMARRNHNLTEEEIEELLHVTEDENIFPEDNISDTDEDQNDQIEGRADGAVVNGEVRTYGDAELVDLALQAAEGRYLGI